MSEFGLQEVGKPISPAVLANLHEGALRLGARHRTAFAGNWRASLDAPARVAATIAALHASTQLMEAMSWLLRAQAEVASVPRAPAQWRAGPAPSLRAPGGTSRSALTGERADLARAVDILYRDIVATDAGTHA